MTTINDDEYPYEKLDSIDPLVPADSGTLFFALDPGRPGFWKTQGDPFLGPWVSNLGPFFQIQGNSKKRYTDKHFFI